MSVNRYFSFLVSVLGAMLFIIMLPMLNSCNGVEEEKAGNFYIGWASVDITPDEPVLLRGQFHARVSEGVIDPITATAMVIESGTGPSSEKSIMISCDLIVIDDGVRDKVRYLLKKSIPDLDPGKVVLNATHTHTAPATISNPARSDLPSINGLELLSMSPRNCQDYISELLARVAFDAWNNREPGGISYGLGHAAVSYNRRTTDKRGASSGRRPDYEDFSHVEGSQDHSVHLLYTWNKYRNLTGVVINVSTPSQVSEGLYKISADFWHETRNELRERLGKDIFIFPQCGAAGDQTTDSRIEWRGEERIQQLKFHDLETGMRTMGRRKQIATRIADAVTQVLPYVKDQIEWDPVFYHRADTVELTRRQISIEKVNDGLEDAEKYKKQFEQLLLEIKENPAIMDKPRWYRDLTRTRTLMRRGLIVKERYDLEKVEPKMPTEVHVIRIDDIVIATNQFELYMDYGTRIKGRSPAIQTFIVQLAGLGTYLPPERAVAGGAYGTVPACNLVGPEGGQELVERTLEMINFLWEKD